MVNKVVLILHWFGHNFPQHEPRGGLFAPNLSFPGLKLQGDCYGNKPKTATLVGVPTYTRPFATIGVMNLLSANWSRPLLEL
jgi:hypothetical protein